jgi:hypothetical protein
MTPFAGTEDALNWSKGAGTEAISPFQISSIKLQVPHRAPTLRQSMSDVETEIPNQEYALQTPSHYRDWEARRYVHYLETLWIRLLPSNNRFEFALSKRRWMTGRLVIRILPCLLYVIPVRLKIERQGENAQPTSL